MVKRKNHKKKKEIPKPIETKLVPVDVLSKPDSTDIPPSGDNVNLMTMSQQIELDQTWMLESYKRITSRLDYYKTMYALIQEKNISHDEANNIYYDRDTPIFTHLEELEKVNKKDLDPTVLKIIYALCAVVVVFIIAMVLIS